MNKTYKYACQYRKNHQFEGFNFVHKAAKTYMLQALNGRIPAYGDTTGRICFKHHRCEAVNREEASGICLHRKVECGKIIAYQHAY